MAFNLGLDQGFKASTPYTNCEHFDTCPYPNYDPTKDPKYKPQSLPTPCVSPQGIDYCSRATLNPLGLLLPAHGNNSQTELAVSNHNLSPPITNVSNAGTEGKKQEHGSTSCINNCTSIYTSHTPKVDCGLNSNLASCHHQQQHSAAYLQALNSGLPNPYKPGSKDYEHYQAGIAARKQNGGGGSGGSTNNDGSGNNNHNNNNNNNSSPDNNTPSSGGGNSNNKGSMGVSNDINNNGSHNGNDINKGSKGRSSGNSGTNGRSSTSSKVD